MSGWQPIETAPKDGTVVDLWAHWPEGDEWRRSADAMWDADMGDWRAGQYSFNQYVYAPTVTHWMPLPSAPGDGAGHGTAPLSAGHVGPQPLPPIGVPAIPDELREALRLCVGALKATKARWSPVPGATIVMVNEAIRTAEEVVRPLSAPDGGGV